MIRLLIVSLAFILFADASLDYSSARVESCRGCSLNRLPEVKSFIYDDLPHYENVVFKPIPGASPELVLLDANDQEVDRIPLKDLDRNGCNSLLKSKGFNKKSDRDL